MVGQFAVACALFTQHILVAATDASWNFIKSLVVQAIETSTSRELGCLTERLTKFDKISFEIITGLRKNLGEGGNNVVQVMVPLIVSQMSLIKNTYTVELHNHYNNLNILFRKAHESTLNDVSTFLSELCGAALVSDTTTDLQSAIVDWTLVDIQMITETLHNKKNITRRDILAEIEALTDETKELVKRMDSKLLSAIKLANDLQADYYRYRASSRIGDEKCAQNEEHFTEEFNDVDMWRGNDGILIKNGLWNHYNAFLTDWWAQTPSTRELKHVKAWWRENDPVQNYKLLSSGSIGNIEYLIHEQYILDERSKRKRFRRENTLDERRKRKRSRRE